MSATSILKLEFHSGDIIEHCFTEAIRIAVMLGVNVEFSFNGVTCIADKRGNAAEGERQFIKALNNGNSMKMAFAC